MRRYVAPRPDRLIVVHDELDLEPGVVRIEVGGGTAGHNGLRSIEAHLHSLAFVRVRIGIGKPRFGPRARIRAFTALARRAGGARDGGGGRRRRCRAVLGPGLELAMNAVNGR